MDTPGVRVDRARIEEIRPLADEYRAEHMAEGAEPIDRPIPQGGIFWLARDPEDATPLGYAAGALGQTGCTVGPVFTRASARRLGVGRALLSAIQQWADATGVPLVEISVAPDNEDGLAFLESLGYQPRRILLSPARPAP